MNIYEEALRVWGMYAQIAKASKELGELLVAMHHWKDGKCSCADLAEEIADVEIVCNQLRRLVGDKLVNGLKIKKLRELRERVNNWG